jgi:hypothetical protein
MKTMRLILASAVVAAGITAALPSQAFACYCEARSAYSWGWGRYSSCAAAKRRALNECAARTPRGYWCYVTYCR